MYAKVGVCSLAVALAMLVVTFNVDVSDALKCYHCKGWSYNYSCGNPFDKSKHTPSKCREMVGYKSSCITYSYTADFGYLKTVRTCSSAHIASGETGCGSWEGCRECNTNGCNDFNYPEN